MAPAECTVAPRPPRSATPGPRKDSRPKTGYGDGEECQGQQEVLACQAQEVSKLLPKDATALVVEAEPVQNSNGWEAAEKPVPVSSTGKAAEPHEEARQAESGNRNSGRWYRLRPARAAWVLVAALVLVAVAVPFVYTLPALPQRNVFAGLQLGSVAHKISEIVQGTMLRAAASLPATIPLTPLLAVGLPVAVALLLVVIRGGLKGLQRFRAFRAARSAKDE